MERRRECNQPSPAHGGQHCQGEARDKIKCNSQPCPVDGGWSAWHKEGNCSKSCGGGISKQRRECNSPSPAHGGAQCLGEATEHRECNTKPCPVDGGWGQWKPVLECTKTCGGGVINRTRECNEPVPQHGGAHCEGSSHDHIACNTQPCPVHGEWGEWSRDGPCSKSCGGGTTILRRECTGTAHGGEHCDGKPTKVVPCNQHDCIVCHHDATLTEESCICNPGFAGDGHCCLPDRDSDKVPDVVKSYHCALDVKRDNCLGMPNSGQEDADGDGIGNACDDDMDNDGIKNEHDLCPMVSNYNNRDIDGDGVGDICDNCPKIPNENQEDEDGDHIGDACSLDVDNDGIDNRLDNCPKVKNPNQEDEDHDGVGDVCDNCKSVSNHDQEDRNNNLIGDACDSEIDRDKDGIPDTHDNCPNLCNCDQSDIDNDGKGDVCDDDDDGDGIPDDEDNCFHVANKNQADRDNDGRGDACQDDYDADKVKDKEDICPIDPKKKKTDFRAIINFDLSDHDPQSPPMWEFNDEGKEITQKINSRAGLAVGTERFSDVRFKGTLYINTYRDDDCVGIIFGYQNNKKFYVLSSARQKTMQRRSKYQGNWQLLRVHDKIGHPSEALQDAIFKQKSSHEEDYASWSEDRWKEARKAWREGHATLLWEDEHYGWEHKKPYRWEVEHRPSQRNISVKIFRGTS